MLFIIAIKRIAGGQPGSGKTHICTAVTGELLRSGLNARYIVRNDEAVKIKANES